MAARSKGLAESDPRETLSPTVASDGPKALAKPGDYEETAESRSARSRLRKSVAALLVLDLVAGAWMYLHAPELLPKLSLANFAIFGISGVLRVLPDDDRAALAKKPISALRSGLSRRNAPRTLAALILAVLVIGAFTSSVRVRSSGGATAHIQVIDGSESSFTMDAATDVDTLTLAQSGGEVIARRFIRPWGQTVWAHTATHVSQGTRIALPWRPARWTYPEDFDEQVTLFVLPTSSAVSTLDSRRPAFVLSDVAGRELVRDTVHSRGARIAFSARQPSQADLTAAWMTEYRKRLLAADSSVLHTDSALVIGLLAQNDTARLGRALRRYEEAAGRLRGIAERDTAWRDAPWRRPKRPLHQGEKVRYAFDYTGINTGPFDVVLDRNPYFLFIDSTAVDKPASNAHP
jgi:hypothetical protein